MIAILTDPQVGGTFLTWSLHYLSGHNCYYHASLNAWVDLPTNPLNNKNSHGFRPNQPETLKSFQKIYSTLSATPTQDFHSMYFHNFMQTEKSIDVNLQQAIDSIAEEQIVLLTLSDPHKLYLSAFARASFIPSWNNPGKLINNHLEIIDDFDDYFFAESNKKWKELNLNNHWDRREFLALNRRPNLTFQIAPNVNLTRQHYRLDTMELWNTFDQTVNDLFNYLNLKIVGGRQESWNNIYFAWRKLQYQRLLFVWYFDQIIDYIINGYELDLTRFNLDLIQESTIQHELIYKHNLNLKTWQLEKFINTKQLHNLLEPNIHLLNNTDKKTT